MPKRRDRSVSSDRYRASPFPSSSSRVKRCYTKVPSDTEENIKEWEEARCPVCMEHPHNAILLVCTSHEKGCRPYMCDTSYRHSNCFDQFRKSFATTPSTTPLQEQGLTADEHLPYSTVQENDISQQVGIRARYPSTSSEITSGSAITVESSGADDSSQQQSSSEVTKLLCPLCRGQVKDWIVVDAARSFMNAKSRSCACESCEFAGTYADLRKHARVEHPLARPTEADPERLRTWRRLERQRDLGDLLSTLRSSFGEERGEEDDEEEQEEEENSILPIDDRGWLTVFFLIRVFQPRRSGMSSRRSSSSSRSAAASRVRERLSLRRSASLWGNNTPNEEVISLSTDEDNSDGDNSHTQRQLRRIRRRTAPHDSDDDDSHTQRQLRRMRRRTAPHDSDDDDSHTQRQLRRIRRRTAPHDEDDNADDDDSHTQWQLHRIRRRTAPHDENNSDGGGDSHTQRQLRRIRRRTAPHDEDS